MKPQWLKICFKGRGWSSRLQATQMRLELPSTVIKLRGGARPCCGDGLGDLLAWRCWGCWPWWSEVWSSHLLLGQLQIGPLEAVIPHMEDSSSHAPCCWGWFNSYCVMHLCKNLWCPGEGPLQSHCLCCNLAAQYASRDLGERPHRVYH